MYVLTMFLLEDIKFTLEHNSLDIETNSNYYLKFYANTTWQH